MGKREGGLVRVRRSYRAAIIGHCGSGEPISNLTLKTGSQETGKGVCWGWGHSGLSFVADSPCPSRSSELDLVVGGGGGKKFYGEEDLRNCHLP